MGCNPPWWWAWEGYSPQPPNRPWGSKGNLHTLFSDEILRLGEGGWELWDLEPPLKLQRKKDRRLCFPFSLVSGPPAFWDASKIFRANFFLQVTCIFFWLVILGVCVPMGRQPASSCLEFHVLASLVSWLVHKLYARNKKNSTRQIDKCDSLANIVFISYLHLLVISNFRQECTY